MDKSMNRTLVISSIICLLPLAMSAVVFDKLPSEIAVHWDSAGKVDGILPRAAAAFALPLALFVINLMTHLRLNHDPRRVHMLTPLRIIGFWLTPVLSLILIPVTLLIAMGVEIPIVTIVPVFTGLLVIICGNYLPKTRQNYTIGIKLPWTLHDVDNWNRTHRLAGIIWVICGPIMIISAFFSLAYNVYWLPIMIIILIAMVLTPMIYSLLLYRRTMREKA